MLPIDCDDMSRLEEEFTKKYTIVDRFDARINNIRTLAFSFLLAVVYAAYLWFVCSTRPTTTSSLLLFGSQIAIGFPATRAYYDWGVSNKEKLHFLDPAKLNGKGKHFELDIHLGDLSNFFEKLYLQIVRYDRGSFDDLNDIAWFGIFVWSAFSSSIFFLSINGIYLYLVGLSVLLIACAGCYLNGYWKAREHSFEDDLNHLQYYVEKRYKELDKHLPKNGARIYVQMKEHWRTIALIDFSIEIALGKESALEFHMGLSSNEKERFVIKTEDAVLDRVLNGTQQSTLVKQHGWHVERIITSSGPIVRVINQSSDFSLLNRNSFVKSPSLIDDSSKNVGKIFSQVFLLVS